MTALQEMLSLMREAEWIPTGLQERLVYEVGLGENDWDYPRPGVGVALDWTGELEVLRGFVVSQDGDDWLVRFWGDGAASANVVLRYRADDQKEYSTLTWQRSGYTHSVARAVSDLVQTQRLCPHW